MVLIRITVYLAQDNYSGIHLIKNAKMYVQMDSIRILAIIHAQNVIAHAKPATTLVQISALVVNRH